MLLEVRKQREMLFGFLLSKEQGARTIDIYVLLGKANPEGERTATPYYHKLFIKFAAL